MQVAFPKIPRSGYCDSSLILLVYGAVKVVDYTFVMDDG